MDWANVNFTLYHNNNLDEKLSSFKGYTYNLVDGKIQKEKVEKKAIFDEEKDENRTEIKIAFPKVVEGSVLEYDYEIISDYTYNLQPWSFQYSIPVLYSEYTIGIPEYYEYNAHMSGYENISLKEESVGRTIVFVSSERTGGNSMGDPVQSHFYRDEVKYTQRSKIYTATNLPAMDDEAYVDNIENYLSKINFELRYVNFPGEVQRNFTTSWEEINTKLLDDPDFGRQLDRGAYLEDDLKAYLGSTENSEEKLAKTVAFIKNKMKWNETYRLYTKDGVKAAYKAGIGNSSEMNLNLVVALRNAGFDAFPIALSTRSHGLVMEWQVTVTGFNHVVAGVKLGDNTIYCDATSPVNMVNLLPTQCLNGKARVIDLNKGGWIDLSPKSISRKSVYAIMEIDENSIISGKVNVSYKDYFALNIAESIKGDDSLSHRREALSKMQSNATIDSLKIEFEKTGKPEVKESYQVKLENSTSASADIIYFSPVSGYSFEKNPFVKVERKIPVNFTYPREEAITIRYKIPATYKVEEIPSNISLSMPESKAKYVISYQVVGNELVVSSKLTIPNILYLSTDYPFLRGFFDEVVKKQNEKVVLKRI